MTRQEFVARVRRRALELLIADDALDLHAAERRAVKELKEIARHQSRSLDKLEQLATPANKGGARARLSSALAAISSRMATAAAIVPRALTPAPTVEEAHSAAPRSIAQPSEDPPRADVVLIFAGHAGGAQFIPDREYPPVLQSVATQNWRASIAENARRARALGRSS
jgi:hypothetical protein